MRKIILLGAFISLACISINRESDDLIINVHRPLKEKISHLTIFKPGSIEYRLLDRSIKKDFQNLSPRDYKMHKKLYVSHKREVIATKAV